MGNSRAAKLGLRARQQAELIFSDQGEYFRQKVWRRRLYRSLGLCLRHRLKFLGAIAYGTEYGIKELKEPCNWLRMSVATQHNEQEKGFFVSQKNNKRRRFEPVVIGKVAGIRTVIEAVPEAMTAFAGAPMIANMERKHGMLAELAKRIHDQRTEHLVKHKTSSILLQRACQIGLGYPDGNDADFLRFDPAILQAIDRHPVWGLPAASQETIQRFESKALDGTNVETARNIFMDHYLAGNTKRPKRVELDLDGSMFKTYGSQEGAIFRGGKYHHEMLYPIFGFISGWLVAATLRMGDQGESSTVLPVLKTIVDQLRKRWPKVPITVRLDSAFGSPELYRWCRQNRVDYEIGLRTTRALDWHAYDFFIQAKEEFSREFGEPEFLKADGKTKDGDKVQAEHARVRRLSTKERMQAEADRRNRRVRVVGEFSYKAESWDQWERILVRVDYTDTGFDVRYVMVSQQYGMPQQIYEDEYCKRGLMEQFIGKFKQTGQKLSAQTFYTNQFRMIMYGVTYQLLFHLQQFLGGRLERCDVHTLRKILMVMPAVIRCTENTVVLRISENHPHCRRYLATWRRLTVA